MIERWSIPGCHGLYCRGEDYWDFVWCYKRAHLPIMRMIRARNAQEKMQRRAA